MRVERHGERIKQLEALQASLEQHENVEHERLAEEARLQLQSFARQLSGPQVVTPVISAVASPSLSRSTSVVTAAAVPKTPVEEDATVAVVRGDAPAAEAEAEAHEEPPATPETQEEAPAEPEAQAEN
jgi:hypothetical protein